MGKLSDIYSAYKKSLDRAQEDYEASIRDASANAAEFHEYFFKDLIMNFGDKFVNDEFRDTVIDKIDDFFGKRYLNFIAVDGSCHKHNSSEFISFYGGAYGAKGTLLLSEKPTKIQYKRWEIEKDVSMVAFVPVPYNRIPEVEDRKTKEDSFAVSEFDRIELSSLHIPIMQLAEVFLAYNAATSSNLDNPDIVLIDNSISGMLGYTDFGPEKVRMVGCVLSDGRTLSKADVEVAQAHPFSSELGVPSTKKFSLGSAIIKMLHDGQEKAEFPVGSMARTIGIPGDDLRKKIKNMQKHGVVEFDREGDLLIKKTDPYQSWEQTKSMFQSTCAAIFLDKRENALKYKAKNADGETAERWMSPDDVRFLIAIGLRALIEVCWKKKILLTGIVKDSSSAYLTKNYLGVCRHFGKYPELSKRTFSNMPPTDRLFCELLPYINDDLKSPWGTIEIDSTFMTLRAERRNGEERFGGTFGGITRPERLFLRSIGQFYTRKSTENILTGHAIFIDRLAYPDWDSKAETFEIRDGGEVGNMSILFYPTNMTVNIGQIITYFLLDAVTKNHFAEMIGYPDPLHKADQGAKSMRDSVKKLLESSELKFRSRPLTNTLREIRQSMRRA